MMLEYGILLVGLARWESDRLYESGIGESLEILGRSVSVKEIGEWSALGLMTGGLVAMALVASAIQEEAMVKKGQLLRKQLNEKTRKAMEFNLFKQGLKASGVQDATLSPSQVADQLKKSLSASKELHSLLENMVEKRKKDRSAQDLWNAVFVTGREVLGLWGVGASFILTGNLLAPLAASVAAGTLRSGCSRVQLPKLRRKRAALLSKLKEAMAQKEKEIDNVAALDKQVASQRRDR
ncbi:hypothetical protein WJX75_001076 [Coccomyxa subellipsoidea]|uniref:Uncharacterized protein n=1 Tax=Coccomyxa subellipsoidea TaxID=248742 RepID=A0ABR2YX14_9CHLO